MQLQILPIKKCIVAGLQGISIFGFYGKKKLHQPLFRRLCFGKDYVSNSIAL